MKAVIGPPRAHEGGDVDRLQIRPLLSPERVIKRVSVTQLGEIFGHRVPPVPASLHTETPPGVDEACFGNAILVAELAKQGGHHPPVSAGRH
jgi:hypothetical protein